MTDLISREAAINELIEDIDWERDNHSPLTSVDALKLAIHRLKKLPAVEAEPVVRCKDCAFYIPWGDERKICGRVGAYYGNTKPDDFCSRSVRMDLEEER